MKTAEDVEEFCNVVKHFRNDKAGKTTVMFMIPHFPVEDLVEGVVSGCIHGGGTTTSRCGALHTESALMLSPKFGLTDGSEAF